ncbi:MAG: hypothetical protein LAN62_04220 [Acidobacteriia bacterium]|nr:hypothetical protein [Terriglobia bacterium]
MNCMDRGQLFSLAHHMLDAGEETAARAHVAECTRCRQVLEEFERLDAVLGEWKPVEPSPWFDVRLRAALAVEGEGGWRGKLAAMQWARWLVPAAVVAALVFAVVVMRQPSPPPQPVARQTTPRSQRIVPAPPASQPEAGRGSAPATLAQKPSAPIEGIGAGSAALREKDETTGEDDLKALEDYDMLANFDVLSELPSREKRVAN